MARFSFQRAVNPSQGGKPPKMTFSQFSDLYGSELAGMLEPLMEQLSANPDWELGDGRLEDVEKGCSAEFAKEVMSLRQWVIDSVERHHKGAFGFHLDHLLPEAFGELADEAMLIVDPSRAKKAVFLRNIAAASSVELPRSRKREDVLAFLDKAKEALRTKPTAAEKVVRGADESVTAFIKRKADVEQAATGNAAIGEVFGMISWVRNAYESRRGGDAPKLEDPRKKLLEEVDEVLQKIVDLKAEEKNFATRGDYSNAAARKTEWGQLETVRLADLQKQLDTMDEAKAEKTRLGSAAVIAVNAPRRPGESEPMGAPVTIDHAQLEKKVAGPTADEIRAEIVEKQKFADEQTKAGESHRAKAAELNEDADSVRDVKAEGYRNKANRMELEAEREEQAAVTAEQLAAKANGELTELKARLAELEKPVQDKPVVAKKEKKAPKAKVADKKVAPADGPPKPTGNTKTDLAAQIVYYGGIGDRKTVNNLTATLKKIGG